MHYEGGIRQFVQHLNRTKNPLHEEVIYMEGSRDTSMAEVAMQYTDSYNELLLSFANNINTTEGGTHETGFKAALTRVLNEYGKKYKLLKDDESFKGEDAREGLTAIISVKLQEAQFEGQTKTKLGNSEMRALVDAMVSEKLMTFFEENPSGRAVDHRKGADRRARPRGREKGARADQKKIRAGLGMRCRASSRTASKRTRPTPRSTSSRAIPQAARPRRAATAGTRPSCRCGARCSTWKRRALTACTATTSSPR